ncbi:siderophore-interacting protein [Acinetobacter larvae]|nr:siderophore-interacting protein [Acinetobacter larvae]
MDKAKVLEQDDHMNGMQQLSMTVVEMTRPYASICRIRGKIDPSHPQLWQLPNVAIRLDVEQHDQQRPSSRIYTVRHYDIARNEIEIDFVIHADASPAMRWLQQAQVGTEILLTGPRPHFSPDFQAQRHNVIFADDTAIPAVYSMLQQWPDHVSGDIYIDSLQPEQLQELPRPQRVNFHFIQHDQKLAAGQGQYLSQAAAQIRPTADLGDLYVWAACERSEARRIREIFLQQHQLDKSHVHVMGYWKAGVSSSVIDELRVDYYNQLLAQGEGLKDFDDLDLNI